MTHRETEIKGLLVLFYRESTRGDYLDALNKYSKEIIELPTKTDHEINRLRVQFYQDCTNHNPFKNDLPVVDMTPHNVFEWIKEHCLK